MNEKFFTLPPEKRRRILNAAYQVFAENSYQKAPMSEIAAAGGISKSLLFHYFGSKRELYLFLWENAVERTRRAVRAERVLETEDFFVMLERSLRAKCGLMRRYPHLYAFSLRAIMSRTPPWGKRCGRALPGPAAAASGWRWNGWTAPACGRMWSLTPCIRRSFMRRTDVCSAITVPGRSIRTGWNRKCSSFSSSGSGFTKGRARDGAQTIDRPRRQGA